MRWFKHMTDASDDEFMVLLEAQFGLEGYARWWKLLESVAVQMDKTNKCSVVYSWVKWQTILKGKRNKLETFLKQLENESRIITKQTGNVLEIKIPKLLKYRDEYSKKSGQEKDKDSPSVRRKIQNTETETDIPPYREAGLSVISQDYQPSDTILARAKMSGCKIPTPDDINIFISHYLAEGKPQQNWNEKFLAWLIRQKKFDMQNYQRKISGAKHNEASKPMSAVERVEEANRAAEEREQGVIIDGKVVREAYS